MPVTKPLNLEKANADHQNPTDLHQLPINHSLYAPAKTLVKRLIAPYHHPNKHYRADEEGFIVICEDGDQDGPLTSIWPDEPYTLVDIPWEGVMKRPGYYEGIFLANNEFRIIFLIPDDLVSGELKEVLEFRLDPT